MADNFAFHSDLIETSHRVGVEFVITDLHLAMTFVRRAQTTQDERTALRNRENARKAYDTAIRLLQKLRPTEKQRVGIGQQLKTLRESLQGLGDVFPAGAEQEEAGRT